MAGERVHANDTVVPVVEPGLGRTRMARLWVYVHDDRPFAGLDPVAVFYRYTRTAKASTRERILASSVASFRPTAMPDSPSSTAATVSSKAACLAHARRKFGDVHETTKSPLACEALDRIGALYRIEDTIRCKPPDQRLAVRIAHTAPLTSNLRDWMEAAHSRISGRSDFC